jgi:predicted transposase/invertase (TIGR01784 family)
MNDKIELGEEVLLEELPQTPIVRPKHDKLFRAMMSESLVYREFFDHYLEDYVKELIDINSIEVQNSKYLNEFLCESICDIVYTAKIKDSSEIGYLYLLLEAQSTAEPMMAFRIAKYKMAIWDQHFKNNSGTKKLPVIYPIIFSNTENDSNMSIDPFDIFENKELARKIETSPHQLINPKDVPDSELLKRVFSGTMEFVMKHGRKWDYTEKIKQVGKNFQKILKEQKIQGVNYISNIIHYNIDKIEEWQALTLKEILNKILEKNLGDEIMGSYAQAISDEVYYKAYNKGTAEGRAEGRAEGIAQGVAQGEARGKIAIVKNLLVKDVNIAMISECTGFSIPELNRMKAELDK